MNRILCLLLSMFCMAHIAYADVTDPFDPFDIPDLTDSSQESDENKSALELVMEASQLFSEERLIDGRTKLLKALRKDPKQYRVHMMLSGYYMQHVGHFRLALRYILQAQDLFYSKNGNPPYGNYLTASEHKQILYLLTQCRLNLDNYQGALDTLEEFNSYGYFEDWYPGTRAWILMKLGKLDEAIRVARLGVLSGAEGGRALNMLGILLSMHGEREESLKVFKKSIEFELSLGSSGEPATPYNNSGEVYKEMFQDARAESSWLRATSLPDGCEHVLPSLNLTLLYIEQVNYRGAKKALDTFEACVAQFPLRNGEEHRALVNFARGRVAMHTGHIEEAIAKFESALAQRQWFGKIGTDSKDLRSGALISLSQALTAKAHKMRFAIFKSMGERLQWLKDSSVNAVRAWWLLRRARQLLTEDLNDFEDLSVRHTDSMLEYPTLGIVMEGFPEELLRKRLAAEQQRDNRGGAVPFYKAYLAQNLLVKGEEDEGIRLLHQVIAEARPELDAALILHAKGLLLPFYTLGSEDYATVAKQIFSLKPAGLRNLGYQLPVNFIIPENSTFIDRLQGAGFYLDNNIPQDFTIRLDKSAQEYSLAFESKRSTRGTIKVRGIDIDEVVRQFAEAVFTEDLGDS